MPRKVNRYPKAVLKALNRILKKVPELWAVHHGWLYSECLPISGKVGTRHLRRCIHDGQWWAKLRSEDGVSVEELRQGYGPETRSNVASAIEYFAQNRYSIEILFWLGPTGPRMGMGREHRITILRPMRGLTLKKMALDYIKRHGRSSER
jgi:hypothetical protein